MKTTALLLLCFIFTANFCSGQNLVPNPSFEEYTLCPWTEDEVNVLDEWSSFGNSPDYFNSCDSFFVGVPNNSFGNQPARTGSGYCGLYTYSFVNNYREYVGVKLSTNVIPGQLYYVTLHLSLAENSNCSTNNLGVAFTNKLYNDTVLPSFGIYTPIYSTSIISGVEEWVSIKGTFTPDSAYEFMIIGNFFPDSATDSVLYSNNSCNAYYYIDDVCVSEDSADCELSFTGTETVSTESILFYPNPAKDLLYCSLKNVKGVFVTFLGNAVLDFDTGKEKKINVEKVPNGTYLLFCEYEGVSCIKKQIIIH